MKLSLKNRVLILSSVFTQFDNRENTLIKMGILKKIAPSEEEKKEFDIKQVGEGILSFRFNNESANLKIDEIEINDEELFFLKEKVLNIDRNRGYTLDALDTYEAILNEEFQNKEYEDKLQSRMM